MSLTCKLLYHKDPTTAFEIEVRKFRFGIGENPTSPLFDHGQTGDDLFILPRDSRNPDICAFTRVHTRVVDLPALWLDAISNLLFDILDCSQAVNETERPPNFEDDLRKSAWSLSTVAQEFYETSLHLTALRPPGAAFWDLIDYRRLAATTFSEIRMHLREARSWLHTTTTSSCSKTSPGRSAAIVLQAAARSAQEHMSSVCRHSAAPGRALLALRHLKGELGIQLQDYDSILSTIRSFLIQEIDYEEAREDIQNILGHHNKALIQTIDDCVLPDLRNIAEEIFPVGLKQRNSQGDNQFQVSATDSLTLRPSDGDFLETRQKSAQFSSGFPKSALSPSREGSAQLCCNYPECTDNFGWPNRYFTRRADLRRHFVEMHGDHTSRGREGSTDVAPGSTSARLLTQADLRQVRSADGLQISATSAVFEAEHDRRPAPRDSFEYRTRPGSYGERTESSSYAVGHDDHYKERYERPATLDQYGEDDDMWIEPREPERRRRRHNPAGRVSHEDRVRYDTREGLSWPSLPLSYTQSQDSMASDSRSSGAEIRRDSPIKDRVTDRESSLKFGRSHEMYHHRSDGDPRRAVEDRVPIYDSRTNDYFLPGEGISREVISAEICRFVAFEVPSYHETLKRAGIWGTTLWSGLIGMSTYVVPAWSREHSC
jgi:hypothetical protein